MAVGTIAKYGNLAMCHAKEGAFRSSHVVILTTAGGVDTRNADPFDPSPDDTILGPDTRTFDEQLELVGNSNLRVDFKACTGLGKVPNNAV